MPMGSLLIRHFCHFLCPNRNEIAPKLEHVRKSYDITAINRNRITVKSQPVYIGDFNLQRERNKNRRGNRSRKVVMERWAVSRGRDCGRWVLWRGGHCV